MSLRRFFLPVAAVLLTSFPLAAHAQMPRFGLAGGVSVPVSDLGDATNVGFNLTALMDIKPVLLPFGLRFEGAWNQFGLNSNQTAADGNIRSLSLTANAVVDFPSSTPLKFYAIGGLGLYNLDGSVNIGNSTVSGDSENKFGLNIGGGLRIPLTGFDTFIEARYHHTFDTNGIHFIPIVFGIRF